MKISGFTFIKNADKLYIPIKESLESILPICDEFVIALGDCDENDQTENIINSIKSDKIKIIRTVWDTVKYPKNTEFARQTDIAKSNCTGDWLFYIQGDEVIHEDDLEKIKLALKENLSKKEVNGFIFKYRHFWGDFNHYHQSHAWYKHEIRIIRNDPQIHSWKDAQSFRRFYKWDGTFHDYQKKKDSEKLNVKLIDAYVYHYGYVRPPIIMSGKRKVSSKSYHGKDKTKEHILNLFDYGPLNKISCFKGSHPYIMKEWIELFDWKEQLQYQGAIDSNRKKHKHEKLKYRIVSFVENKLLFGKSLGGFKNFKIIR